MPELLDTFSIEGEHTGNQEKKAMHQQMQKEFFETGKVSIRHKDVKLLLLTGNGRVVLQRRSKWKGDNPGKWDKTVGGHIESGDSADLTMLKECAEELGIPATIVKTDEFEQTLKITDLNVLGILTRLTYLDNFQSKRELANGQIWTEPSMTQFYIGYYDGAIRFIDKESCGIQVFTKEELENELQSYPDAFTEDVRYILSKFHDNIKPVTGKRKHELNY